MNLAGEKNGGRAVPKFKAKGELKTVIEADQWVPGKTVPGVRVLGEKAFLDRMEGDVEIAPGDWIIRGEFVHHAVGDSIFRRLYEAA